MGVKISRIRSLERRERASVMREAKAKLKSEGLRKKKEEGVEEGEEEEEKVSGGGGEEGRTKKTKKKCEVSSLHRMRNLCNLSQLH